MPIKKFSAIGKGTDRIASSDPPQKSLLLFRGLFVPAPNQNQGGDQPRHRPHLDDRAVESSEQRH